MESKEFIFSESDFVKEALYSDSPFDLLLKKRWLKAQDDGLFLFQMEENSIPTRIISDDVNNFYIQLNSNRKLLRRKPTLITSIQEPFNPVKFNFTKASTEELLFIAKYENSPENVSIYINNSPVEFCNSLMIPQLEECMPQVVTKSSIKNAIYLVALSGHKALRMGFNSLGAAASVNHLHWHLYYFPYDMDLEVSTADEKTHIITDWPFYGYLFEIKELKIENINETVDTVFEYIDKLLESNLSHNIIITRNRKGDAIRIILWPRPTNFADKDISNKVISDCNDVVTSTNPGILEFSGHFIVNNNKTFHNMTFENCTELVKKFYTDIDGLNNIKI